MIMKKGYVYAMMAAVAAMTVSGCSSSSSAPASTAAESKTEAAASSESGTTAADTSDVKAAVDTIKFGLVAPLSGDNGAYGTKQEKGYELAMEEINAAGGVLGAKLELETYDDGGDASTAANGAQKFADDDSILAIGGSCLTSCTAAMLPITGDAEMPQLVVSSSAKSLTGISDYFFRMAVQDAAVGPPCARPFITCCKNTNILSPPVLF
jgi:branched-chain amino acid transport system substrate-binding protein